MKFEEMLGILREPPEEGLPDTIYDDMLAVYNEAYQGYDSAQAVIGEKDAVIETLNAEISRLKAHNYELMMALPSDESSDDSTESDTDEENVMIDDLFGDDE